MMTAVTAHWYLRVAENLNKWFKLEKIAHRRAICQILFRVAHPKACKKWDCDKAAILLFFEVLDQLLNFFQLLGGNLLLSATQRLQNQLC
jgi:hypothetical protein